MILLYVAQHHFMWDRQLNKFDKQTNKQSNPITELFSQTVTNENQEKWLDLWCLAHNDWNLSLIQRDIISVNLLLSAAPAPSFLTLSEMV